MTWFHVGGSQAMTHLSGISTVKFPDKKNLPQEELKLTKTKHVDRNS